MYFKLCLVRVKYFPENKYFPEMLFSGKENIFQYLVVFQNIFWKIFSGVWLYSWKCSKKTQFYHVSYIFLHFLSFQTNISSTPTKYKFIKTQILNTQQKKIHQIRDQFGSENNKTRTIHATRGGLTQSKQIGDSAGRSWVWRMVRLGFATIGDEWVWWWTSSTIWGMGSTNELDDLRNGFAIWRFGHCSTNELSLGFSRFVGALGCESISPSPVLVRSLFRAVSLSLFYFPGAKVIWSENENGNYFPPLLTLFYGQTEMTEFSVIAKHPLFRKIISGINLKSIQTQP